MHKNRIFAWMVNVSLLLLFVPLAGATTYYVSVSSGDDTNSGLSWAEAKAGIQPAIDLTSDGDTVLVSNGIYEIGEETTISISNAVLLRSIQGPADTIISSFNTDMSQQPCLSSTHDNAIVEGFTIQNRCVDTEHDDPIVNGAGVYMHGGLLTNCIVRNNRICWYSGYAAGHGAGIYCVNAEIANCQIISNNCRSGGYYDAYNAYGGGICAINSTIRNCLIQGNDCTAPEDPYPEYGISNDGTGYGGGIFGNSSSEAFNCIITKNHASHNGGGAANVALHNCTITDNSSDNVGGGMYQGSSDNCIIYYNTANTSSDYYSVGCSYTCSSPLPSGSGNLSSAPILVSRDNLRLLPRSPCLDRGINRSWMSSCSDIYGDPRIVNDCVDIGADEYYAPGCTGNLTIAILVESILGRCDEIFDFEAEVTGAVSDYFWSFGDGSPVSYGHCVTHAFSSVGSYNVVLTATNQTTFVAATQRILIVTSASLYVATNGSDSASGLSWNEARATVSSAVDDACANETILVSNGLYLLSNELLLDEENLQLLSVNGPAFTTIKGNGSLRGVNMCASGVVVEGFTILGGGGAQGAGVSMTNGTLYNCNIVHNHTSQGNGGGVFAIGGSILSCTINSNSATGSDSGQGGYGGGVYAYNTVISNCIFTANGARGRWGYSNEMSPGGDGGDGKGGGLYASGCTIAKCSFNANYSVGGDGGAGALDIITGRYFFSGDGGSAEGGGIYSGASSVNNVILNDNHSYGGNGGNREQYPGNGGLAQGGGIHASGCQITNTQITGCSAQGGTSPASFGGVESEAYGYGGGAYGGSYYNVLIVSNTASYAGGGTYGATLYNCTIVDNVASNGGGIYGGSAMNCIVYYNAAPINSNQISWSMEYSCTTPSRTGAGNISDDPQFTDRANGDYTLSATSPCVNNGTNEAWMVGAKDLAGNDRIQNVCVDMGAYESPYWGHFSDVDHDGCTDYDEMTYLGTDATNNDSYLGLLTPFTTTSEDGVVIQWQSTTGIHYNVSRITGLSDPLLFTTLATNVPGQVDSTSYTDTTASAESCCFYRISVEK